MASISEYEVDRITNVALDMMARHANAVTPYGGYTAGQIAATVAADPLGETAFYFAQAIADGIEHLVMFKRHPGLLEIFGAAA